MPSSGKWNKTRNISLGFFWHALYTYYCGYHGDTCVVGVADPGRSRSSPEEDLPPQGPVFIAEPPSQVVFANTRGVVVPCTAYGRPAPALDWVGDGDRAVDDIPGLLRVLPNNTLHVLPFQDAEYRPDIHNAHLRCEATNQAGTIVSRRIHLKAGETCSG